MTIALNMDLTGTNETYRVKNRVFKIVKYGQIVNLETAVFADSIEVTLITSGVNNVRLQLNEDYVIPEDAITECDNDLSAACIRDPDFDKQLTSGIEIIRPMDEGVSSFLISVSYQRLYPQEIAGNYYDNDTPVNLTPNLIREIIAKLATHDTLLNRVTDITSLTDNKVIILETDTTGTKPNNHISDEYHRVNVSTKQFLIHPHAGAFYGNSLKIVHPNTGTELVRNTDYILVGMNEPATKATSSTDTVWEFIAVTSPVYDEVKIEYQAFGGQPTIDNYRNMSEDVASIIAYLNNAQNVTADTIGTTPALTKIFERINRLEDNMRRLLGTPTYGDVTNGKTVIMSIMATTPGLHWYTIASMHTINTTTGASPVATADTFTFRLQSSQTHFQFTCCVAVDLTNRTGDVFNIQVLGENYPKGYTSFKDYTETEQIIRPQLRVVWNDSDSASGAHLQLGFDLKSVNKEVIALEDCSGQESAWKLVDEIDEVTLPDDTDFLLPDGLSTWSDLNELSKYESMMIPFHKGHLLWFGNIDMNRPLGGWKSTILSDELLIKEEVDITRFRKLRINIAEEQGNQFAVDIPFNGTSTILKGHATFTHQEQPAYVNAEIYYDENNGDKLTVDLNYQIVAGESSIKLSVKDMVIFLN